MPEIINLVKERYHFSISPNPAVLGQDLTFQRGNFSFKEKLVNISEMKIQTDTLLISVESSTSDAEEILQDLLELARELGSRELVHDPILYFQSSLVVEFDRPFNHIISGFEAISKAIAAVQNFETQVDVFSVSYSADPDTLPPEYRTINSTYFKLDRRRGSPYSENRLYCEANMRTDEHIRVLEQIESAIAAQD